MQNLNHKDTYYNTISIYKSDPINESLPFLIAEIFIDENNYCEGIISNKDNRESFIFGIFNKFNFLNLYEISNDNKIRNYQAVKTYLQYDGECYSYELDDSVNASKIYLKAQNMEVDPRDYIYDNPKIVFLERLNKFKTSFLSDPVKSNLYQNTMTVLQQDSSNTKKAYK